MTQANEVRLSVCDLVRISTSQEPDGVLVRKDDCCNNLAEQLLALNSRTCLQALYVSYRSVSRSGSHVRLEQFPLLVLKTALTAQFGALSEHFMHVTQESFSPWRQSLPTATDSLAASLHRKHRDVPTNFYLGVGFSHNDNFAVSLHNRRSIALITRIEHSAHVSGNGR